MAKKEEISKSNLIIGGIVVIAAIVGVVSFIVSKMTNSELTSASALTICSIAANDSNLLKDGTKTIDREAMEYLDVFNNFSDNLFIRSWLGKYNSQNVQFDCYIDKSTKMVTRLTAIYDGDQEEIQIINN